MSDQANPYMPPKPEDGRHWHGPQGSNERCELCGAYKRSVEEDRPCKGEYAESESMRIQVAQRWAREQAKTGPIAIYLCDVHGIVAGGAVILDAITDVRSCEVHDPRTNGPCSRAVRQVAEATTKRTEET